MRAFPILGLMAFAVVACGAPPAEGTALGRDAPHAPDAPDAPDVPDAPAPAATPDPSTDDAQDDGSVEDPSFAAFDEATKRQATYTRAEIAAKLFGYLFADGNFFTDDAAHAENPSFKSPSAAATLDFVALACKAGYTMTFGGSAVSCSAPPSTAGSIVVRKLAYPHGGDLDAMTDAKELRAFFSGLLIPEGSRNGQVDDQYPNVPAGHYSDAEAAAHVGIVVRALRRLGFATAHLSKKDDAPCAGDTCREARIDVAAEGCKFADGYTFVSWKRVPGGKSSGGSYVGPAKCP